MKHPLRDRLNGRRFKRAQAKAQRSGEMVCAVTNAKGRPIYFLAPRTVPDAELEARAFAVRNGRAISTGERMLQSAARAKTVRGAM